jgi:hypothetical protein
MGPTGGQMPVRWRWEVGLPLIVIGTLTAATVLGASDAGLIFWAGVLVAGIGVAIFFSGWH